MFIVLLSELIRFWFQSLSWSMILTVSFQEGLCESQRTVIFVIWFVIWKLFLPEDIKTEFIILSPHIKIKFVLLFSLLIKKCKEWNKHDRKGALRLPSKLFILVFMWRHVLQATIHQLLHWKHLLNFVWHTTLSFTDDKWF